MALNQSLQPALLTVQMAADYLSVSRRTLEYLVRSGDIARVSVGKRAPRIARQELDDNVERLRGRCA